MNYRKLYRLFIVLTSFFAFAACEDDDQPNIPIFEKSIKLGQSSQLTDLIETEDGTFLAVGIIQLENYNDGTKMLLMKIKPNGDTLWTKKYSYEDCRETWGNSILKTKDGNYVVAGFASGSNTYLENTFIHKLNNEGETIWATTLSKSHEGNYGNGNIAETPDGGFLVISNPCEGCQEKFSLDKVNPDGTKRVTLQLPGIYAGDIKGTKDGYFVIAGTSRGPERTTDVFLTKVNPNGYTIWSKSLGDDKTNHAHSVHETPDGGFAVSGHTGVTGMDRQIMLLRTNSAGEQTDLYNFGQAQSDVGLMINLTKKNEFLIAGYANQSYSSSGFNKSDLMAISVSATGQLTHSKNFGNSGRLLFIRETNDGGVIMGGQKDSHIFISKTGANL